MASSPHRRLGRSSGTHRTRSVIELPILDSDAALVAALRSDRAGATTALFKRHGSEVERVLYRILGLQEVFVTALGSLDKLRDPDALHSWLTGIAVRKARKCIVRRQRWRLIQLLPMHELPEREALLPSVEVSEALRCTYAVLEKMPADERVAFALRHVDGMELTEVAAACGVSLATIKRRLTRAQSRFTVLASGHAALAPWLDGGDR
jgi:RNA polymerase sigma-70 factor, ECF subfamily